MSQLVTIERAGHWYSRIDGTPVHTVIGANGKERSTTIADARKRGDLYPSVTSIINSVLAKPALTSWLCSQAILASLTLPRITDESVDDFAKRAVRDMEEQSSKAASFGTEVHKLAETWHLDPDFVGDPKLEAYLADYKLWFKGNVKKVIHAETVLLNHTYGYAGTVDLIADMKDGSRALIDLKTQGVKEKARTYPEWQLQLSAYAGCHAHESNCDLISIVVDSSAPNPIYAHKWPSEENGFAQDAFLNCLKIYRWQKSFPFTPQ